MAWVGLLFGSLVLGSLVSLFVRRERAHVLSLREPTESHYLSTRDGWEVALHRYPAPKRRSATPVVLFHGLGGTERVWSLMGEESWVHQLHQAGYDVWTCSWRGEGRAQPRRLDPRYAWGWPVQALLEEDLPALWLGLGRLLGGKKLHCVGHGLGGRVLLEMLQAHQQSMVLTCTLLGVGEAPRLAASSWLGRLERGVFGVAFPWSWFTYSLRVFWWLASKTRLWKLGFADSRTPSVLAIQRWLLAGNTTISAPVMRQWLLWQSKHRGFLAQLDESFEAVEKKETIQSDGVEEAISQEVRWLFVVGDADPIAPLEAVERLLRRCPKSFTQTVCLPLQHSLHAMHYSHLDLLISPALRDDFFPSWLRWLEEPTANFSQK